MEAEADEKRPYWPLLAMASADYVFGTPLRASVLVFGNTVLEITVRSGCYGKFPIHPEPALWDFCPRRTGFFVAHLAYSRLVFELVRIQLRAAVAMARKYRTACLYGKDLQQRLAQCVILVKGSSAQGERKEQINSSVVTVAADTRAGSRRNFAPLQRRFPMAICFRREFSVRDRRSNIYLLSALNNSMSDLVNVPGGQGHHSLPVVLLLFSEVAYLLSTPDRYRCSKSKIAVPMYTYSRA
ncbi:hypothetical protein C8F01DRAFT_1228258 [Mycena amicta]|nr:hypothetical protein C8F01DRAFT_1228258 [Mycena amicta]